MRNINDPREEERSEVSLESWVEFQTVKREPESISNQRSTINILMKAEEVGHAQRRANTPVL